MTKHLLLFSLLLFLAPLLTAQNCTGAVATDFLHANSVYAWINSGGALFNKQHFIPNPQPGGAGPSTLYVASLWMGGKAPDGQLKLMAGTYGDRGSFAGPLNDAGFTDSLSCLNWDRVFKMNGADIPAFLKNLAAFNADPNQAIQLFPEIMGWPAQGNPFFAQIQGFDLPSGRPFAPFFDEDGDGLYNPLKGDYPQVELENNVRFVPAAWTWSVYNGFGAPTVSTATRYNFQTEIHLTAWAFHCDNQPVLENTVFTAHRIFFRGTALIDSCYVGMWADFDIGCPLNIDDQIGCLPDLHTFFAYEEENNDPGNGMNCPDGSLSFGQYPPAQSVTFLGKELDKFMYYNNPSLNGPAAYSTDPDIPNEYYNYLKGFWKDGLPLSTGNTGYNPGSNTPANHAFPGNPLDPTAWTMCTAPVPSYDRRALGSHYLGQVEPGRQEEFVIAWTYHPDLALPCNLGTTFGEIATLHVAYDNHFGSVCSPLTNTPEPNLEEDDVEMYPNPAGRELTLRYGDRVLHEIRLLAPDGRLVRRVTNPQSQQTVLSVNDLAPGVYLVQCIAGRQSLTRKVVLHRE